MSAERNLIEAVLDATQHPTTIDAILATPAVQTALAEVRGDIRNPDATEEDPMVRDVEAWFAANPPATPKPKLVMQWEDVNDIHYLYLGSIRAACVWEATSDWRFTCILDAPIPAEPRPTLTEARTAAEQAVRDWIKRAGCV